jgi:integrase
MATLRTDDRKDGTQAHRVFYRHKDRHCCLTFDDRGSAEVFKISIEQLGAERALALHRIDRAPRRTAVDVELTVTAWIRSHIDQLTGVKQYTLDKYEAYLKNDITPVIGAIPLADLDESDISRWVKHLEESGVKPKTLRNKYGFLSGALNAAVPKKIPYNPAAGRKLKPSQGGEDDHDMQMLTHQEFATLLDKVTPHWKLLVEFLVASGCRWGEASALQPKHVDTTNRVVRIRQAWEYSSNGYTIGPPKTKRSRRDVDLPADIIDRLDLTGEWVFRNRTGGPVRYHGFLSRVWNPACRRAELDPRPTPHDLRHTCASWMQMSAVASHASLSGRRERFLAGT